MSVIGQLPIKTVTSEDILTAVKHYSVYLDIFLAHNLSDVMGFCKRSLVYNNVNQKWKDEMKGECYHLSVV